MLTDYTKFTKLPKVVCNNIDDEKFEQVTKRNDLPSTSTVLVKGFSPVEVSGYTVEVPDQTFKFYGHTV